MESLRDVPADLVAAVALAAIAVAVSSLPTLTQSVLGVLVGLPATLFAPGYVLLAVLFPESEAGADPDEFHPDWPARLALSVGLSVAAVPLVALVGTTTGLHPTDVPVVLGVLTAAGAVAAAFRRNRLPPARRLDVGVGERVASVGFPDAGLPSAAGLARLALAISVCFAATTVAYAVAVPNDGESYSSLYLGTENESGDVVSGSYPTEFAPGERRPLVVGVENHEDEPVSYAVRAEVQRVAQRGNRTVTTERESLRRFEFRLAAGDAWERSHTVAPTMTGEDLRLQYSLYRGEPPSDPSAEPYRRTYVWIDVAPAGGG